MELYTADDDMSSECDLITKCGLGKVMHSNSLKTKQNIAQTLLKFHLYSYIHVQLHYGLTIWTCMSGREQFC